MRAIFLSVLMTPAFVAQADPIPQVAVISGAWMAGTFLEDEKVTTCVALGDGGKLGFRADANDLEIRVRNPAWSLSASTTGQMTIEVGKSTHDFPMQVMDSTTLMTPVSPDDIKPLLDAMNTAPVAKLHFGKKTTEVVSLSGSTKALNDWRTCVGSNGFGDVGSSVGNTNSPF